VKKRYRFYAMAVRYNTKSFIIPDNVISMYNSVMGWTAHSLDALADRLIFREFANDDFESTENFDANNPDIFFDTA
ncbi:hypothetical protein ACJBWM_11720, partial [Streptococcus suis]